MDRSISCEIKKNYNISSNLKMHHWEFYGGPVVKTLPYNGEGAGSIPGQAAKIPHALWPKKPKHKKQKQDCNKLNKDFKNSPHEKTF